MSVQIPNLHTSNPTRSEFKATVHIARRKDAAHAGVFSLGGTFQFNPATDDYPSGQFTLKVDLSDSVQGVFTTKDVQQLNTTGKHTPTLFATGRCDLEGTAGRKVRGCRYWLLLADNRPSGDDGTPDMVSFLIFDRTGVRVAYGTGPVVRGSITIGPTSE